MLRNHNTVFDIGRTGLFYYAKLTSIYQSHLENLRLQKMSKMYLHTISGVFVATNLGGCVGVVVLTVVVGPNVVNVKFILGEILS